MKKFSVFVFAFSVLATPAWAGDYAVDNSNWGLRNYDTDERKAGEASENTWNQEKNNYVYEGYGSEDSPGFLNSPVPATINDAYNPSPDYEDDPYEDQ